jgi:hypothetical protein
MLDDNYGKVLIYTITHGSRRHLNRLICSFTPILGYSNWEWLVILSGADSEQIETASKLNNQGKIHYLVNWEENRGQHHANKLAIDLAIQGNFPWILRIDDDVSYSSVGILGKMLSRLEWLRRASKKRADEAGLAWVDEHKLVAAPRIVGLRNPLPVHGLIQNPGQIFPCESMHILGGAFRLSPVSILQGFDIDIYAPLGRKDPEQLWDHVISRQGMFVRFPDLTVRHHTDTLEAEETPQQVHARIMGMYWPFLESAEV